MAAIRQSVVASCTPWRANVYRHNPACLAAPGDVAKNRSDSSSSCPRLRSDGLSPAYTSAMTTAQLMHPSRNLLGRSPFWMGLLGKETCRRRQRSAEPLAADLLFNR